MQIVPLSSQGAPTGVPARPYEALAGVIAEVGARHFGPAALAHLNRWMPLCWWSIYRLFDDQPPVMHASGSFEVPDGTHDSWRVYRASLYRRDETFLSVRDAVAPGAAALLHWDAKEIPARHRREIYSRHGLRERLSIVSQDPGGLLAVNFYRHLEQPAFADDEIDAMRTLAAPLLACVNRHLALSAADTSALNPVQRLTGRERDVCERLLKAWTHEGIAADLGLSPATVKTYRDRAFERLGIRHRNELFALVAGSLDTSTTRN